MGAGRIWGGGIEWDAVRALLAREARTAMGREQAMAAEPLADLPAIQSRLATTAEARRALGEAGPPPLDGVPDVRPLLDRCRVPGGVLDGTELITLVPLLETNARLPGWGQAARPAAPSLAALTDALPRLSDLLDALRHALADDGSLNDHASPRLKHLRREIRERRRRIVAELEGMLQSADADRAFADHYVTLRHGRYVLPVRAEARQRVRGIVHDRSQSGQTLFIEPAETVEANNDVVQLMREEDQEAERILAALTGRMHGRLADLEAVVDAIASLDWTFARAHLAERMRATAPVLDAGRTVGLRGARHPLLLAQSWERPERPVIPVDLELAPERPVLVITGPNAGGKTIALKTLALHALMTQIGCHLPADEGSRLPVFADVFAIIGDDQSVAENLSTFSAFVGQARQILIQADERSLVLLDELGAGTDPDEGAALAQAILEALAERGALVVATTHLEPLKAFASTHPRARNASVEFDTATLAPTFRLRYDRPGQSLALTIAARLGLPPALIARAQQHRSEQSLRLGELLGRLDEHARTEAERVAAIERREQEAAARLAAAGEAQAQAERQAREVVSRARSDAASLLADIRRAVAAEWDRLKRAERTRRDLEATRRRLSEVAGRLATGAAEAPAPGTLGPGAAVAAEHLGLRGELVAVAGGTATVRSGAITVRVPLSALRAVSSGASGDGSGGGVAAPGETRSLRAPRPQGSMANRSAHPAGERVVEPGATTPAPRAIPPELMLIGRTTDEARDMVEQYLDDAFMAGLPTVRLIHGKGTGALRKAVRDVLASHPLVESFRDGEPFEGGSGATVAALKVGA